MEGVSKIKKKIVLSLSWRDIKSPGAGGAEIHTHELLKAIDKGKYRVVHIAFAYDGLSVSEVIDDVLYIRHGSYLSYILYSRRYYRRNRDRIAAVLDQCNTWRAFSPFWVRPGQRIFYIHQLTREIWHIQSKGLIAGAGESTESAMLRLNRKDYCITVSESTKEDLINVGFDPEKIVIIPNGLPKPLLGYNGKHQKEEGFTLIYVGRYAKYKGIDDTLCAFGELKKGNPGVKLWLVGKPDDKYLEEKLMPICSYYGLSLSRSEDDEADVIVWGFVEEEKKYELMQRAHLLICPSVREGWGIIISEAGFLGTPSVVYDSPGLRDAVDHGKAGFLCRDNSVPELKEQVEKAMNDSELYESVRSSARDFASGLLWEKNKKPVNDLIDKVAGTC